MARDEILCCQDLRNVPVIYVEQPDRCLPSQ